MGVDSASCLYVQEAAVSLVSSSSEQGMVFHPRQYLSLSSWSLSYGGLGSGMILNAGYHDVTLSGFSGSEKQWATRIKDDSKLQIGNKS